MATSKRSRKYGNPKDPDRWQEPEPAPKPEPAECGLFASRHCRV